MAKINEVGVIGLGKFGFALASALADLGHTVIGVDNSPQRVRRAQDVLAQVYEADATNEKALEQIGFKELDKVIVSTGSSMEASILVVFNLQALGLDQIWVKATSEEHERVLYKLGVPFVVFPEAFVAIQLAHRLVQPDFHHYFGMGNNVVTREVVIENWAGRTLRDLALTTKYKVQVMAIRPRGEAKFSFVPQADSPLNAGDVMVLIGDSKDVMQIEKS